MKIRTFRRPDRKSSPFGLQYLTSSGSRRTQFFSTEEDRDHEAGELEKKFHVDGVRVADVDMGEWRTWCELKKKLGDVPVRTAVDYYLQHHQGTTSSFAEARERYIADQERHGYSVDHIRHLVTALDALGEIGDPFDLKAGSLQKWFDKVEFVAETKRNYRKYFRAFYNYCEEHAIAVGNPANHVKLPRFVRGEPEIASLAQIKTLFSKSWKKDPGATARMALEAFAGLRASAAGRIAYSDINFKQRGITLRSQPNTKNERRHYIDGLPPTVWSYLKAVDEKDFIARGTQYMHRKSMCVVASGVKLPKNALRHSFVTYLCAWKKNADLAAYIIGHRRASSLLFDHYRGIASKEEGKAYFEHTLEKI